MDVRNIHKEKKIQNNESIKSTREWILNCVYIKFIFLLNVKYLMPHE
jgi:hypothetical protein